MTREEYQNRVLGCFVGKNIGGTLGMPMEWERSKNDVTYYTHDITGDPLPNDDLDIQILWLLALEEQGLHIDSKILGQYFNEYMIFTHAEYRRQYENEYPFLHADSIFLYLDHLPYNFSPNIFTHLTCRLYVF